MRKFVAIGVSILLSIAAGCSTGPKHKHPKRGVLVVKCECVKEKTKKRSHPMRDREVRGRRAWAWKNADSDDRRRSGRPTRGDRSEGFPWRRMGKAPEEGKKPSKARKPRKGKDSKKKEESPKPQRRDWRKRLESFQKGSELSSGVISMPITKG